MTDLMSLISRLIDPARNILVPGVDDMVRAAAAEERLIMVLSTWRARRRRRLLRVGWRSVIRATSFFYARGRMGWGADGVCFAGRRWVYIARCEAPRDRRQ
ncbi:hypothetical protein B0H13DRAFT_2077485 [Mycena leptocephala]|nr:hypothetical protein B0H13DRAFT_2077485 [Mycena leptocephala]